MLSGTRPTQTLRSVRARLDGGAMGYWLTLRPQNDGW